MKRATILFTALWLTLGAAAAGNPKADPRAVVEAGNDLRQWTAKEKQEIAWSGARTAVSRTAPR